eukprot:Gregarina_sp_Pseudo_9__2275@NODE_2600_length_941_cov_71_100887_g2384_i0_p1_GENE_NODE_2600_length_941_cov_71_100887_g2384_i0NODE_2600_length_941_cov_71_100887_g2384_i0_p1_ORF_typecomplete_len245_score21_43_NODE_2600_length_941_cov_71_100887_g2384_i0113847
MGRFLFVAFVFIIPLVASQELGEWRNFHFSANDRECQADLEYEVTFTLPELEAAYNSLTRNCPFEVTYTTNINSAPVEACFDQGRVHSLTSVRIGALLPPGVWKLNPTWVQVNPAVVVTEPQPIDAYEGCGLTRVLGTADAGPNAGTKCGYNPEDSALTLEEWKDFPALTINNSFIASQTDTLYMRAERPECVATGFKASYVVTVLAGFTPPLDPTPTPSPSGTGAKWAPLCLTLYSVWFFQRP